MAQQRLGAKLCAAVLEDQLSLVAAQDQRRSDLAWARFQKSSVRPEFLAAVRAELTRLGQDSLMAPPGVEAEQLAARMQARVTLTELLTRCPDFEVDEPAIVWSGGSYVRRPMSVPIRVGS